MSAVGVLVIASVAMCAAVLVAATGWRQPRPRLDRSVRHLRRHEPPADLTDDASLATRLGLAAMTTSFGERSQRWRSTLRLIGRDVPTHLGLLVISSLLGLVVPTLMLALLHLSGWVSLGLFIPVGVAILGAALAPVAVHGSAVARSDEVRIDIRHQLSAYLDLVTMLLAGNTGHEGALEQAARAGDGLLFIELRRRMREVATTGNSLVGALALVGDDFGVVELEQVAAAAQLSAREGAPVARTLAAKCATLRSTLSAEQEASARVRNDKITPPLVGMAVLFMALIIYPALNL